MTELTREEWKNLHARIRGDAKLAMQGELRHPNVRGWNQRVTHREMLLLWGFVRDFKFRRIERTHRNDDQRLARDWLLQLWAQYLPWITKEGIDVWLEDPTGAIPAPPPRLKKTYMPAAAE